MSAPLTSAAGGAFVLAPQLNVAHAAALREQWLAVLPALAEDPCLDGSEVQAIDSAGIQLLLALRRSLRERGAEMQVRNPSPALREACALLGLDEAWKTTA
jgi:anti-sigma B factor antagonist